MEEPQERKCNWVIINQGEKFTESTRWEGEQTKDLENPLREKSSEPDKFQKGKAARNCLCQFLTHSWSSPPWQVRVSLREMVFLFLDSAFKSHSSGFLPSLPGLIYSHGSNQHLDSHGCQLSISQSRLSQASFSQGTLPSMFPAHRGPLSPHLEQCAPDFWPWSAGSRQSSDPGWASQHLLF